VITGCTAEPEILSWCIEGGPERASITLRGQTKNLFKCLSLLRCYTVISAANGEEVWWGYVEKITLFQGKTKFEISLEELYNKVKVIYSYPSPEGISAAKYETSAAESSYSQSEYGQREITIRQINIDDDTAENLRDTFLEGHFWPRAVIEENNSGKDNRVEIVCAGWFKTFGWVDYECLEGYIQNNGPGPGSFLFGDAAGHQYPGQQFMANGTHLLKTVFFMLKKVGSPTQNIYANLLSDSGGTPNAVLATSDAFPAASLSANGFEWVRFAFSTPYTLTDGVPYWLIIDQNGISGANYFSIRIDDNMNYLNGEGKYFNGANWVYFANGTHPHGNPDLYFRAVCVQDTGTQLDNIANAGNQFYEQIITAPTGVETSPYALSGASCLSRIRKLMQIGTANQRPLIAVSTKENHLYFYEQPEKGQPTTYLTADGKFITARGIKREPYDPPIGEWVGYGGTDLQHPPFDVQWVPLSFISRAVLNCKTGHLKINGKASNFAEF
jgi:hypothetical protein